MNFALSVRAAPPPKVGIGEGTAGVRGSRPEGEVAVAIAGFDGGAGLTLVRAPNRKEVGVGMDGHTSFTLTFPAVEISDVRPGWTIRLWLAARLFSHILLFFIASSPANWPGTGTGGALRMLGSTIESREPLLRCGWNVRWLGGCLRDVGRLVEALDILLENDADSFCQVELELLYAPPVDGVAGD